MREAMARVASNRPLMSDALKLEENAVGLDVVVTAKDGGGDILGGGGAGVGGVAGGNDGVESTTEGRTGLEVSERSGERRRVQGVS